MRSVAERMKNWLRERKYGALFLLWKIRLLTTPKNKRVFIFCAPDHGNLGDQAIMETERQIFAKRYGKKLVEISSNFARREKIYRKLKKIIKNEKTILIHGGGFLGDVWTEENEVAEKIIKDFKNKKIIIMPQTVDFKNAKNLQKSAKILNGHKNLTLMTREKVSYKIAKENYKNAKVVLTPDVVLTYEPVSSEKSQNSKWGEVLCLMRRDVEKKMTEQETAEIVRTLRQSGLIVKMSDTVVSKKIGPITRRRELKKLEKEIKKAEFVVTDRLHGMVLAKRLGKEALVFNNNNHKIRGVYEWIKNRNAEQGFRAMFEILDGEFGGGQTEEKQPEQPELAELKRESEGERSGKAKTGGNQPERARYSKYNAMTALIANATKILIGFVAQKIFLTTLGAEFLGLNGLFNNVVAMLAIAELGIGSAIVYNLYEPIARGDRVKVRQLISFYKKAYKIIAGVILGLGILVAPLIPMLAGGGEIKFIIGFYLLFLFDVFLSYTVAYKSSLISAHQKNYINNIIQIIYVLVLNVAQMIFLLITKQYLVYLLVKIAARILQNILISIEYKKNFSALEKINAKELDKETKNDINKKVRALIVHKISAFLVTGTDNLIISKFLGLVQTGLYSNYAMIINSVQLLFSQMFNSIIANVGNLLTEKNQRKSYDIYGKMLLLNYLVTGFSAISIFFMMEPFIKMWVGEEYLLSTPVLLILTLVFYSYGMRNTPMAFKSAGGIFVEDRMMPIIESAVNLVASLILVKIMGLFGVFLGTLLSSLVLHLYSYPVYVYKKLFGKKPIKYVVEQAGYFMLFLAELLIVYLIHGLIKTDDTLTQLILNAGLCLIIPNAINLAVFWRTEKLKYLKKFLR